jgi:hypothetical protein
LVVGGVDDDESFLEVVETYDALVATQDETFFGVGNGFEFETLGDGLLVGVICTEVFSNILN